MQFAPPAGVPAGMQLQYPPQATGETVRRRKFSSVRRGDGCREILWVRRGCYLSLCPPAWRMGRRVRRGLHEKNNNKNKIGCVGVESGGAKDDVWVHDDIIHIYIYIYIYTHYIYIYIYIQVQTSLSLSISISLSLYIYIYIYRLTQQGCAAWAQQNTKYSRSVPSGWTMTQYIILSYMTLHHLLLLLLINTYVYIYICIYIYK